MNVPSKIKTHYHAQATDEGTEIIHELQLNGVTLEYVFDGCLLVIAMLRSLIGRQKRFSTVTAS